MKLAKRDIASFRNLVFRWWKTNRRDLPWRHTRDPYRILVSEIMLQQTQVSRVLPKYLSFLAEFPTVHDLARATNARVLIAWKGLGYNRRALYLKKTAEMVVRTYHGKFPDNERELLALPGLGTYTARALLVFAYGQDVAMVDTNIRQIIVRYFFSGNPQKERVIREAADTMVPPGKSWEWHQALMDFGALALKRTRPEPSAKKSGSVPFAGSRRFIRGKIMDLLRERGRTGREVVRLMKTDHGSGETDVRSVIRDLIADGLAERKGNTLRLPQ